jgi:hypothetical protein
MEAKRVKTIKEIAALFPEELRDCPDIVVAGGFAFDPETATDVDIFFVGETPIENWNKLLTDWAWHSEVALTDKRLDNGEYVSFYSNSTIIGRIEARFLNIEQPIDIILHKGYSCPEHLLSSFDIAQSQIGYLLNGEMVTGKHFIPPGESLFACVGNYRAHSNKFINRVHKYNDKLKNITMRDL